MASLVEANEYHGKRLTADAWFAETEERREQSLQSADDLLRRLLRRSSALADHIIYEQAAYMMTDTYEAIAGRISSRGLEGLSVSYQWDKEALIAPAIADELATEGVGACRFGRIRAR